jgi:hypothetical protein
MERECFGFALMREEARTICQAIQCRGFATARLADEGDQGISRHDQLAWEDRGGRSVSDVPIWSLDGDDSDLISWHFLHFHFHFHFHVWLTETYIQNMRRLPRTYKFRHECKERL